MVIFWGRGSGEVTINGIAIQGYGSLNIWAHSFKRKGILMKTLTTRMKVRW